jgi:hypothetical protein
MPDAYVYYFTMQNGPAGENTLSLRPATLGAIKGKGEPIMESQIVVDETEVDGAGFLISRGNDDLTAQIQSVEIRASSRDGEAQKLNDTTEGADKYMLSLESRELRNQARMLKNLRTALTTESA